MLRKIDNSGYMIHLREEDAAAQKGEATIFTVRRMNHEEVLRHDIEFNRILVSTEGVSIAAKARNLATFWCSELQKVVSQIENYEGGKEPLTKPKEIADFGMEYMTSPQILEIMEHAKGGTDLVELDARVRELRKNA